MPALTLYDGPRPLPPELEREIFELTVKLYPAMTPVLPQVAHRVRVWIEPFLYKTLIIALSSSPISPPSILLPFKSKPSSFFRKSVRNLLLDDGQWPAIEQFNLVLSVCSGVLNLALTSGTNPSMLPYLKGMKLQRLTISLQDLFSDMPIDLTLISPFATITHLDVLYTPAARLAAGFASLPALTHLHLYIAELPLLRRALRECQKLKVLIHTCLGPPVPAIVVSPDLDDPRVVLMDITRHDMVEAWRGETQGWRDLWAIADLFVARRNGLVESSSPLWLDLENFG
ncbi:hypothetical protein B0H19DRAFT_1374877 [Mycena capillaripes]|nr:hypothetical protein B0H19DRAFT_1374877 [Mycena capillaripes]